MSFTKALYYPTIDIEDEEWLKTAVLFWDEINTIVPSSIDNPYQYNSTQYLSEKGVLKPIRVDSNDSIIDDLTSDVLNYLNTNEGLQLFTQFEGDKSLLHINKLPIEIINMYKRIHPEKLSYELQHQLKVNLSEDGWFLFDSRFANYYMTLLANKIGETSSIALLSDNPLAASFTDKVRLDNQCSIRERSLNNISNREIHNPSMLTQGMFTNLIIQGIKISNNTTLEDILEFKIQHRDELGLFRQNIEKLTMSVNTGVSLEALQQQIVDIYVDEFTPAYNNFKKALSSSKINWVCDKFIKISLISMSTINISTDLLGMTIPHALLANAGISLVTSIVLYNQERKEQIRSNPYSYLLSINKQI